MLQTRARRSLPLALALVLAACEPAQPLEAGDGSLSVDSGPPVVLATNFPLAYMAQRIAREAAVVEFPDTGGVDPADWQPDREALARFQAADLVLLNGPAYSPWVQTLSLGMDQTVDTTLGFRDRWIEVADAPTHAHGPEGAASHSHLAFTTWLDPALAIEQAVAIGEALTRILPGQGEALAERVRGLTEELAELDRDLLSLKELDPGRPLLASHPVYAYLARKLDLRLESMHFEPDQKIDAEGWRELDRVLESHPARRMIWEAQPLPGTIEGLLDRKVACFVVNPSAGTTNPADFLQIMRENARQLKEALSGPR